MSFTLICVAPSCSFLFGFLVRGLFALSDSVELDELRAGCTARDAEIALLKRMAES